MQNVHYRQYMHDVTVVSRTLANDLHTTPEHLAAYLHEVYQLNDTQKAKALSFVQRIANIVSHILTERHTLLSQIEPILNR